MKIRITVALLALTIGANSFAADSSPGVAAQEISQQALVARTAAYQKMTADYVVAVKLLGQAKTTVGGWESVIKTTEYVDGLNTSVFSLSFLGRGLLKLAGDPTIKMHKKLSIVPRNFTYVFGVTGLILSGTTWVHANGDIVLQQSEAKRIEAQATLDLLRTQIATEQAYILAQGRRLGATITETSIQGLPEGLKMLGTPTFSTTHVE